MLVDLALVERLEQAETATVASLVDALVATGCTAPVPTATPAGRGLLVVTGPRRYVNRALGTTLDPLDDDDVAAVVARYADAGLPAAVQLSSWAHEATVRSLGAAGFVPVWCRSVLAVDPRAPGAGRPDQDVDPDQDPVQYQDPDQAVVGRTAPAGLEVLEVGDDPGLAARAADVMAAELVAGPGAEGADRSTSDEFMAADRVAAGTVQLLARLDGVPVGCGSLTVVRTAAGTTGWLGAAATVPEARRRGVQTALVAHRLRLAARSGCDLVGVTASVGSTSARVLRRSGFALVQEQWVVQRG